MIRFIRSLFIDYCPKCNERLTCSNDLLCCTKACPYGHYSEEIYGLLGVRFVYKDEGTPQ
jgi:hypothetical protein